MDCCVSILTYKLEAFHWCPDYDGASKEFARILKPDGVVAFIWNLEDRYDYINQTFHLNHLLRLLQRYGSMGRSSSRLYRVPRNGHSSV